MRFINGVLVGLLVAFLLVYGFVKVQGRDFQLSGKEISQTRDVSGFNKILLSGSGVLNIEQGDEESITVHADEKLIDHVVSEVVGNELRLKIDSPTLFGLFTLPSSEVTYDIKLKNIEKVQINGSGKLNSDSLIAEELEFVINGSGDVRAGVEVKRLTSNVSGSGAFTIPGKAEFQEVKISGSGKYFAKELESSEANITISGSGNVEVNAADKLNIKISGSGNVLYLGNPEITQSMSGSGKVEKLE